jgi:hypothetical protein
VFSRYKFEQPKTALFSPSKTQQQQHYFIIRSRNSKLPESFTIALYQDYRAKPRRYVFHETFKPKFHLKDGTIKKLGGGRFKVVVPINAAHVVDGKYYLRMQADSDWGQRRLAKTETINIFRGNYDIRCIITSIVSVDIDYINVHLHS